jgi:hypothetical protein
MNPTHATVVNFLDVRRRLHAEKIHALMGPTNFKIRARQIFAEC